MVNKKQIAEELSFFDLAFQCINEMLDIIYRTNYNPQTEEDYDVVIDVYLRYFFMANALIDAIPSNMNSEMKERIHQFLLSFMEWFQVAGERMKHLKGKVVAIERYTFLDDRKYRKKLNQIENELSNIGESINQYKLNLQSQADL